jgi:hypothetical protein
LAVLTFPQALKATLAFKDDALRWANQASMREQRSNNKLKTQEAVWNINTKFCHRENVQLMTVGGVVVE